ncbi:MULTISPECIES: 2Fe-2S iron-sulfur cluster-binding protein [unclassified Lentimonas]|uniref:2Fe-2S iron-sulfur cluster-binding protein n=1 Tax=unclassified Lentimonas TaxID=2630993 RepID=UPI00132B51EE|nr:MULTISPECIES: 2Fe-2S iron-sulfur cluster-binding protein [unclassified Lentimonas]CAA6693642.1 NADH-ubiquinone oxidoreductase chain G (EC [Lentimonas sp. CC10]CAA6697619.1 NADH-ubiquinone oxidoreductase chain G (EC [Lentimonas sp. CC19]CAA7070490.1 NADH-ubiquinone oxidoreductase chain G (EC [Lentimonas sp. CC11]
MNIQNIVENITINIDGVDVAVPKGINIIEAVKIAGKGAEVPHYCYHPKLSISGNCRMCMVEMGMPMRDRGTGEPVLDENGVQKIGWMPKPTIGCATNAAPGMHIRTNTEMVKESRNGVTEFLLINHPLDCPICDQAGECKLQEFSAEHGRGYSRFIEQKNVKPKRTKLGSRVTLDDERCILCARCIRFSKEIAKDDVLGFVDRGTYSTLTCYPGKELEHNYSLNTVDICPVGALTSTDFRFKMRVWFLKRTNSICTESSVGANTEIWSREGKIYRITPRRNDAVNDTWMTDSARELFKASESDDRLTHYTIEGVHKSDVETAAAAAELLKAGDVALVGSAGSSVEEQFFYRLIADRSKASVSLVSHTGEGDGILLSEDRTPNLRGALLNGLISKLPEADLTAVADKIKSGAIKTLVVVNEDVTQLGIPSELLAKVKVIYFGTHANAVSQVANVVCPSLMVYEKDGSFVNQSFILQKFKAAVPGPRGIQSDVTVLEKIVAGLGEEKPTALTMDVAWERIADTMSAFEGLSWRGISDEGVALDPAAFIDLPFVETKNLKFDPVAFKEAQAASTEA